MPRIAPSTRRILLVCFVGVVAGLYGIAWFSPAIGLAYSDGASLVAAVTRRLDGNPPLFPALLAVFAAVSRQALWLKLAPMLCTFAWLAFTVRLLKKMGASRESAWVIAAMTAASPTVIYLSTGLFAEPLFALLTTVSLLALLEEKPLIAGVCAGLATLTITAGAVTIAACLITLLAYRRLRSAAVFTCTAMVFAAPWLGWTLAHGANPIAKLYANEAAVLVGRNVTELAASPFVLLTGYPSLYPALLTAVALLIVLIRRRQFVPDLFVGFYCLALIFRTELPLHGFAPVLPLVLWMLWRVARTGRFATVTQATAIAMIAPALWFGAWRVLPAVRLGAVASDAGAPDNWHDMEKLFAYIRANTPGDTVLLADLDPVFFLDTGRRTVRGFLPDSYRSYYAPPGSLVTPDQLRAAVLHDHVSYVVLTPDRDLSESASFHKAVGAMERGGLIEPVSVPGESGDYRLLRVVR